MSEKQKEAINFHKNGYNCAQAVVCTFAKDLGIDEKIMFTMSEAFGFGMGTMGTCGAVSAMAFVAGIVESDGQLSDPKTKKASYKAMKKMTEKFQEKNKSTICRVIKGVDTGEVLRSCDGCIEDAVEILEEYLSQK